MSSSSSSSGLTTSSLVGIAACAAAAGVLVGHLVRERHRALQASRASTAGDQLLRQSRPELNDTVAVDIMLHDISKPRNLENIVQTAAVLGVRRMLTVGRRKQALEAATANAGIELERFQFFGNAAEGLGVSRLLLASSAAEAEAAASQQPARPATSWSPTERRAVDTVVVGIEIVPGSVTPEAAFGYIMERFPQCRRVVLLPGNEGHGMTAQEKRLCHLFVCVPQMSASGMDGGVGSLNVCTATTIVAHQMILARQRWTRRV